MKNKIWLCGLLLAMTSSSWATKLKLNVYDQAILSDLIAKFPADLISQETTRISNPVSGKRVHTMLTDSDGSFTFSCLQTFYRQSHQSSLSLCEVDLDLNSPALKKKHDELKLDFENTSLAQAFYEAIPYGKPVKELYSIGLQDGISYEGVKKNIFDFRFSCKTNACTLRFSVKRLSKKKAPEGALLF